MARFAEDSGFTFECGDDWEDSTSDLQVTPLFFVETPAPNRLVHLASTFSGRSTFSPASTRTIAASLRS